MNQDPIRMRVIPRYESMVKKGLKELKITTYTNKVHLPFRWFNHKNFKVKCAYRRAILYFVT